MLVFCKGSWHSKARFCPGNKEWCVLGFWAQEKGGWCWAAEWAGIYNLPWNTNSLWHKCLLHHNSSRAPWSLALVYLACFELEMLLLLVIRNSRRHHGMFLAGRFETRRWTLGFLNACACLKTLSEFKRITIVFVQDTEKHGVVHVICTNLLKQGPSPVNCQIQSFSDFPDLGPAFNMQVAEQGPLCCSHSTSEICHRNRQGQNYYPRDRKR